MESYVAWFLNLVYVWKSASIYVSQVCALVGTMLCFCLFLKCFWCVFGRNLVLWCFGASSGGQLVHGEVFRTAVVRVCALNTLAWAAGGRLASSLTRLGSVEGTLRKSICAHQG